MRLLLLLAAALAIQPPSLAQGLKDGKTTLQAGNWRVLRTVDAMTDKVECTGIYKNEFGTQLSSEGLYIRVAGGIESITLRFNDRTPRPMRLASKLEKDVRAVVITGDDYLDAVQSKRLRYQVLTLVAGVKQGDLDLTGIDKAYLHILDGCPDK